VLNVVPGFGQTAGKALALHMDVDCIAFTGSTATGRMIMQYAGQSNLKRVSLECAASRLTSCWRLPGSRQGRRRGADAIFSNQGEMCSAGSRLLLQEGIKDACWRRCRRSAASASRVIRSIPPRSSVR